MFYVYEFVDVTRAEVFYVGKCMDANERLKQHLKAARSKRNGPAFLKKLHSMTNADQPYTLRVVFETSDEAEAFSEEARRIAHYGRRDQGTGCLLNHTDGGQGRSGAIYSEATRQRWSEVRKGRAPWNVGKRYKHNVVSPKKGRQWTETQWELFRNQTPEQIEQRRSRASESHKGQVQSEENRKRHSERMRGEGNPNFGKVGYYAGKVGPRLGMASPVKGKKLGPDRKMYTPQELFEKFGIRK